MELCFDRIADSLEDAGAATFTFPVGDLSQLQRVVRQVRCVVMQGGQGDVKHWAFNDPLRAKGSMLDAPPSPEAVSAAGHADRRPASDDGHAERAHLGRRQYLAGADPGSHGRARGNLEGRKVSIWQAGCHDNPFGMRLTSLMISKGIADSAVPMSLLADHPNVQFNFLRSGWAPAMWKCIELTRTCTTTTGHSAAPGLQSLNR